MKISKINLCGVNRIRLQFPFDCNIKDLIKQIEGVQWSHMLKAWHLPYLRSSVTCLEQFFPGLDYDPDSFKDLLESSDLITAETNAFNDVVYVSVIESDQSSEFLIKMRYKNPALYETIRTFPDIRWNRLEKGWLLPNNSQNLSLIFSSFRGKAWVDASQVFSREKKTINNPSKTLSSATKTKIMLPPLSQEGEDRINQFRDWLRSSRYSESTFSTYSDGLKIFFRFCANRSPQEISNIDLINFNNQYILKYGYSASFQNQVINAIKLYFRKIENRVLDIESIKRPRKEHRLPNVLSKEEIADLIKAAEANIKHQAMLSLIYSCGLRRSELINLKIPDVDSRRGLLIIRNAKGKKDRVTPLSDKVVELLRNYYRQYRTKIYLFEGWNRGEKYSDRSLEEVLKKYIKLAGINKPVTLHWLRHSYATHLLENGTDLRYIQEILGHKSSRTTEIYTHVSTKQLQKIRSPFDDLDL
jgi:integrase/recombinase XerD